MTNASKDWSCSACLNDFPFSEKPCLLKFDEGVQPEMVCADCLRAQFLSAQANEIDYPVKWQSHILHPRRFRSAFDQSFVRAYEAKEKEYNTPAMQRAYCDCGKFVAPMVAADAMSSWRPLASSKPTQSEGLARGGWLSAA